MGHHMKKIFKIGYIGNGPISNFHVPALKANKFKIEIFYYRKNSKLAKNFINKHQIKNSTTNLDLFYSKSITECDAMVICVKTEFVCQYLRKFANYKKPVLVEKPGAINYTDLYTIRELKISKKIFFGYNRRYYENIEYVKKYLTLNKKNNVLIKIPDNIQTFHQFIINGCHIIDLIFYLFGNIKLISKSGQIDDKVKGFVFNAKNTKNIFTFIVNWGVPDNFSIDIFSNRKRVLISPIETTNFYEEMKIIEPTDKYPLRKYEPKIMKSYTIKNFKFKPGFKNQYKNFYTFIKTNKYSKKDCDFKQALKVLSFIEEIKMN